MPAKAFFDTNVLIYALSQNDPRGPKAEALLSAGGVLSIQVLNEFAHVARRKLHMPWKDLLEALDAIRVLCPSPMPVTIGTHEEALRVSAKYGYSIFDALIVAAALRAECVTLYSEDFQNGQIIANKLTIRNPFV